MAKCKVLCLISLFFLEKKSEIWNAFTLFEKWKVNFVFLSLFSRMKSEMKIHWDREWKVKWKCLEIEKWNFKTKKIEKRDSCRLLQWLPSLASVFISELPLAPTNLTSPSNPSSVKSSTPLSRLFHTCLSPTKRCRRRLALPQLRRVSGSMAKRMGRIWPSERHSSPGRWSPLSRQTWAWKILVHRSVRQICDLESLTRTESKQRLYHLASLMSLMALIWHSVDQTTSVKNAFEDFSDVLWLV